MAALLGANIVYRFIPAENNISFFLIDTLINIPRQNWPDTKRVQKE